MGSGGSFEEQFSRSYTSCLLRSVPVMQKCICYFVVQHLRFVSFLKHFLECLNIFFQLSRYSQDDVVTIQKKLGVGLVVRVAVLGS